MLKLSFKDNGLHLDDKRIYGIVDYEIKGHVDEPTILKLELFVDDSEMFSKSPYEFTNESKLKENIEKINEHFKIKSWATLRSSK